MKKVTLYSAILLMVFTMSLTAKAETSTITDSDLRNGFYYGSLEQKKINTPANWIHSGEGTRSAKWSAPKNTSATSSTSTQGVLQAKERLEKRLGLIEQRKLDLEKKLQERKIEREQKISDKKIKLDAVKKEKILKTTNRLIEKLENTIKRLENHSKKLSERIKSFEEKGADMTKSKELLAVADQTISTTKAEIAKIKEDLTAKINSGEIALNEVRVTMQTVKELIKDSKDDLVAVISSIKASIKK